MSLLIGMETKKEDLTVKRIAIIAPGYAWLPGEFGTSRFSFLAGLLSDSGYEVDLIGSTFQHFKKEQRDIDRLKQLDLPYKLVFIPEPGYRKNVDVRRIYSNYIETRNVIKFLNKHRERYHLIYCVIPPNILSAKVGQWCQRQQIPYIVDVEDLWPEAMKMVVKTPILNDILFIPYWKDAEKTYRYANGVIGTSDEYTLRAFKKRRKNIPYTTVYVGTDLDIFDEGVRKYSRDFSKSSKEFRVTYAGSISASYDVKTLIDAAKILWECGSRDIRFCILGTGSLKKDLEHYANALECENVKFLGYVDYQKMAAFLVQSDVLVNSYIKKAPQSIVTKIGDYLAAGKPVINTLASIEFMEMVDREGFGVNVVAENAKKLAKAVLHLYNDAALRTEMSLNARRCAEEKFDRKKSYGKVVKMIRELVE